MIATVPTPPPPSIDQQGLLAFYLQIGFNAAPTLMRAACGCAHVTPVKRGSQIYGRGIEYRMCL